MPKWVTGDQRSGIWIKERLGCLTASRMKDAIDILKSGKESEARRKYKFELLAERLTNFAVERYVNDAMQWGIDNEAGAKAAYEAETGVFVTECGFALHDTIEFFGASPDGLIGDDGLIEIKCPTTQTHLQWLLDGGVPEQHKPQMLAQMAVTQRRWCDFASFDPRLMGAQQLMIVRYQPEPAEIAAIEEKAQLFLNEVEEMFYQLTTGEIINGD